MSNEDRAREDLLAVAGRASSSLIRSVAEKAEDAPIETNVASLRGIARVITELAAEVGRCGGSACMGRSIDDVKLWVTQDRFDVEKARADRAVALANQYAATLHAIAAAAPDDDSLGMLVDWPSHAASLHAAARAALTRENAPLP
ncbi:hypothetical protein [Sphingomonas sp.]|jgi:hypothetical protein|uniref:hypothetical protein n=1 Tax=Sphingomonas sp. TaxID=28214 RepID=UPI002ED8CD7E